MNTGAFTNRAEAYAKARPGYPDEAIEYIRKLVPPNAVFADVGAGTGILTALIAGHGYEVFAVEPNADMLEQLAITLAPFPKTKIFDGTAETTKLPDNCVDVITNAQSLRRFDIDMFRAECLRIGKANPIVITVFNGGNGDLTGYGQAIGALYRNPDMQKFPNPLYFTRDKWHLYYASMEGVPLKGDAGYETWTAELNERFDRDSVDGMLREDVTTYVYSGRIG